MKFNVSKDIVIAAHRGYSEKYNENTMEAFLEAIKLGVDMIETDIHLTKEGIPVIIHDHDVERTTDGEGLVREMRFEDLRKLNAGNAFHFSPIPTLDEFLDLVAESDSLLLDLEIKVYLQHEGPERVKECIDKTVAAVRARGLSKRVLFNSFDAYVLEYIHKTYGKEFLLHGYYPYDKWLSNMSMNPEEYMDYACYWGKGEVGRQACEYLLSKGITPCTGSRNKRDEFFEAVPFGCQMFTENDAKNFSKWKKEI